MSDGRIDFLEKDEAPDKVQQIYEGVESQFGMVLNIIKTLGHSPSGLETVLGIVGMAEDFKLEPKFAELAYLKATEINECHY